MWFTIHTNWWQIYAHREHRASDIFVVLCIFSVSIHRAPFDQCQFVMFKWIARFEQLWIEISCTRNQSIWHCFQCGEGGLTLWRTHTIKQETKTEGKTAQQQQRQQHQQNNNNNNNNNERSKKKRNRKTHRRKNQPNSMCCQQSHCKYTTYAIQLHWCRCCCLSLSSFLLLLGLMASQSSSLAHHISLAVSAFMCTATYYTHNTQRA